ncbi:MAG TPA: cell division protein ZapA [Thermoclostridium sp.]|nr:cell division protein ZapA [Clostridiaceae bacterium]HOQ76302.1 cell division protein ZapA [Thermoclostridium sp.]HPU44660.1 cell division protein ZapA [Thermoclostridium sp.]
MSDKNKVVVRIAGNEYILCGSESPEYIQKIAMMVDRKLRDITRKNHLLSTSMASVLTAVNMADELVKTQEAYDKSEYELKELKKKIQELREDVYRYKQENEKLKEVQSQLQIELTRRETELKEVRKALSSLTDKP